MPGKDDVSHLASGRIIREIEFKDGRKVLESAGSMGGLTGYG
jgi:hypothetical protein